LLADDACPTFDERFGLLVDAEWLARENARLRRALKKTKLRMSNACVQDIDYAAKRELDEALVRQLASCRWVAEHQNVIISGKTGTGKTYIACALAQQRAARATRRTTAARRACFRESRSRARTAHPLVFSAGSRGPMC
jgi:hypothetical protein